MKNTEKKKQATLKSKSRINRKDLAELLAIKLELPVSTCDLFINEFVYIITSTLKNKNSVIIKDFGKFESRLAKKKVYNGAYSKAKKVVPAHYRPKFNSSHILVNDIN